MTGRAFRLGAFFRTFRSAFFWAVYRKIRAAPPQRFPRVNPFLGAMTPRQQSILIGAVVTGILSSSYLGFINILCCLGVIIGGVVASQQYVSRTGGTIRAGDGAVLGALAGVGGSILGSLFNWMLRPLNLDYQSIGQSMTRGLRKQMMQQGGEMSPEMMQQLQGDGPGMLSMMGILFFLVGLIIYAIFGAIGGALGTALFGGDGEPGQAQPGQAEWSE